MRIDVFTIFPELIDAVPRAVPPRRARNGSAPDLRVHDLRDFTTDVHRTVDDSPFGGGAGMVLTPGPDLRMVEADRPPRPLLLLGPGGRRLDQAMARELAAARGSRCCAAGMRGSTSGCGRICATARSPSAISCWTGVRSRPWSSRGRGPAPSRGHGQRGSAGGGVVRRRPARVPAVHATRGVPRAGRCPRCCARATTRFARGAGRRPWRARSASSGPDEAAGRLSDADRSSGVPITGRARRRPGG